MLAKILPRPQLLRRQRSLVRQDLWPSHKSKLFSLFSIVQETTNFPTFPKFLDSFFLNKQTKKPTRFPCFPLWRKQAVFFPLSFFILMNTTFTGSRLSFSFWYIFPKRCQTSVLKAGVDICTSNFPTGSFIISEPQNQEIDQFYILQKRRVTDFKTPQYVVKRSVG